MHWSTLYPALLKLFGNLAANDDQDFHAEDHDRPRRIMSDVHKFTLAVRVLSVIGLGEDEERFDFIPTGTTGADAKYAGKLRSNITGQRKIRLQLEADAVQNTDTGWAWAAIERIRTRMRRRSSLDALDAVDAALIRIGQGIEANFSKDGRKYSRVILEIELGAVVNDLDPVPTGWIEKVQITGHIQDVDGTELPHPPNPTDHLISAS